jgi:hypothetical protein
VSEAFDHRFEQVPDMDVDGKREEECSAIDESGKNDSDRNDR